MTPSWHGRHVTGALLAAGILSATVIGGGAAGCAQAMPTGGGASRQLRPLPTPETLPTGRAAHRPAVARSSAPPESSSPESSPPESAPAESSESASSQSASSTPASVPTAGGSGPPSSSSEPAAGTSPAGSPGAAASAPAFESSAPASSISGSSAPEPGAGGSGSAPPAPPGTDPFAGRQIVAYYGAAGTASLGVLGDGTPAQAWAKLDAQATPYDLPARPALRCFELIATVASSEPGSGDLYRNRVAMSAIEPYLATVRAHGGTLLLDIQPGRSDFLTEAEALEPLLAQPDVGLALDPEWRMTGDQLPGKEIGSVSAAEVNSVSSWLDALTVSHHLPDKLFVVHEFTGSELRDEDDLADRPHLHEIVNVDGFGSVAVKLAVYHRLSQLSPFEMGLKLFYRQDPVLLSPAGVEALRPRPQLIDYE